MEENMEVPQKLNMKLSYNTEIILLMIYSRKAKNANLNRQFNSYSEHLCSQQLKGGNNCPLTGERIHRMLYRPIM